jgi:hypothetical protein
MSREIQKNSYSNHNTSDGSSGFVRNARIAISFKCDRYFLPIACIFYRIAGNQEELSANNRKHTEDYVLEEFNKSSEVLSLPLPNSDGTFHGKLSSCRQNYGWI